MTVCRSGFVGLVGRPNVGKSAILNAYLGEKIAIVSPCPQTTRHRIVGILTREDAQVMFVDSPGFHKPQHELGRSMLEIAKAVVTDADVLVVVIEATKGLTKEDGRVFDRVKQARRSTLLAINKVDLVKKPLLLPILKACAQTGLFEECVPVSAVSGEQMDVLLQCIISRLPEGPHWYEPHQRTDQARERRIGELIREQVLLATRQEVPHAVAVHIDEITDNARLTVIRATILVERPGQKAIVIGRAGHMLKHIGRAARLEIEQLLQRRVFLELWVKVVEEWRSSPRILRELGYIAS